MSDDLVKGMRERAKNGGYYSSEWDEAADRIEQLESLSEGWKEIADEYFDAIGERNTRIEKLEAALREIADGPRDADKSYVSLFHEIQSEARKALEGKDD